MTKVVNLHERCMAPVIDEQKRARVCRRPAVTTSEVEGVDIHLCAEHAADIDAQRSRVSGAEALNFADPAAVSAWLSALDVAAQDLAAVAEDQVRPFGGRDLARRAARAIVAESASSLENLIRFARAGLLAVH